jgi:hypothetical protein
VAVEKRNIYHSVTQIPASQALVSFKKYMPPPLPYFKVSICPLPLPHFASIFWSIFDAPCSEKPYFSIQIFIFSLLF